MSVGGRPEARHSVALLLVLAVLLAFGGRLTYIQAFKGPALAEEAQRVRLDTSVTEAPRGEILDSNGVVLATSIRSVDVIVDLTQIPDFVHTPEEGEPSYGAVAAARLMAPILEEDERELGARLVGERRYSRLARSVTPSAWREIRALGIGGVTPEYRTQRVYPAGNTAGNVVGFVNSQGGAAGLEYALDEFLTGEDGEITAEIGYRGQVIPTGYQSLVEAVPGGDVHLTIDRDLQWAAQVAVDETVARYGAQWGAAVVIEIGTSRVLALADSGAVDPNDPGATEPESWGSRAVQNVYEPGSTGKVATLAAAIEEGLVEPTTVFTVPYQYRTENGQLITNHSMHPTWDRTATGILAESSNTGTVLVGQMMSDQTRYDYLRAFGLGESTGLGLPGESRGILHDPEDWDGRTRYTTMFGQGLAVNLVQNTGVFATLGNGGVHVAPRIVDGFTDSDGTYQAVEPGEQTQVVSRETAQQMIRMMESVVEDGTGKRAAINGYRVAGKTGTAQVADGAGGITATVASFVGVAPAEAPRVAIGVVVYKPTSGFYGGTIAAPIFSEVGSFALQTLGVAPSTQAPDPYPLSPDDPRATN